MKSLDIFKISMKNERITITQPAHRCSKDINALVKQSVAQKLDRIATRICR